MAGKNIKEITSSLKKKNQKSPKFVFNRIFLIPFISVIGISFIIRSRMNNYLVIYFFGF